MRDEWQSLIPFYVAGTLPEADRRKVEFYLEHSADCRQALEDWLIIRDAIHAQSKSWASELPPLSAFVRSQIEYADSSQVTAPIRTVFFDNGEQPVVFPKRHSRPATTASYRSLSLILSVAASLLIVFAFVGLLILRSRVDRNSPSDYGSAAVTSDATAAELIYITPAPRQTRSEDMGIIPKHSEPTAPSEIEQVVIGTPDVSVLSQSVGCMVQNASSAEVPIYMTPDVTAMVLRAMAPDEQLVVEAFSTFGWYQVRRAVGEQSGWLRVAQVSTSGNCSDIPVVLTTATATDDTLGCMVTELINSSANLFISPDRNSSIITIVSDTRAIHVLGRTEDGSWYRTRYDSPDAAWVGWINAEDATFSSTCQRIGIVSAATPLPTPDQHTATRIPQRTQVNRFEIVSNTGSVLPGDSVDLSWTVQNADNISIEMYNGDVDAASLAAIVPVDRFLDLGSSGQISVTIPSQYDQSSVVFVLVIQDSSGLTYDLESLLRLQIEGN